MLNGIHSFHLIARWLERDLLVQVATKPRIICHSFLPPPKPLPLSRLLLITIKNALQLSSKSIITFLLFHHLQPLQSLAEISFDLTPSSIRVFWRSPTFGSPNYPSLIAGLEVGFATRLKMARTRSSRPVITGGTGKLHSDPGVHRFMHLKLTQVQPAVPRPHIVQRRHPTMVVLSSVAVVVPARHLLQLPLLPVLPPAEIHSRRSPPPTTLSPFQDIRRL